MSYLSCSFILLISIPFLLLNHEKITGITSLAKLWNILPEISSKCLFSRLIALSYPEFDRILGKVQSVAQIPIWLNQYGLEFKREEA
jgi:hypothetical protein